MIYLKKTNIKSQMLHYNNFINILYYLYIYSMQKYVLFIYKNMILLIIVLFIYINVFIIIIIIIL